MCTHAAAAPGMPAASGPLIARSRSTSPASSRYMSSVAAPGASSRPSTIVVRPSAGRCSSQKPPPPIPEEEGSTTARAADTATAASNALPPAARTSNPASVASSWAEAMAALPGPWACAEAQSRAPKRNEIILEDRVMRIPGVGKWACACGSIEAVVRLERGVDAGVDEFRDVAVESGDFLDQARRDEAVFLGRRQEHRFRLLHEVAIHRCQLELVFEVRDRAQTAQNDAGPLLLDEARQEIVETDDLDVLAATFTEHRSGQLDSLGQRKRGLLVGAFGDGDDHAPVHARGALDQIGVTVGQRVEGAGIDRDVVVEWLGHAASRWERGADYNGRRACAPSGSGDRRQGRAGSRILGCDELQSHFALSLFLQNPPLPIACDHRCGLSGRAFDINAGIDRQQPRATQLLQHARMQALVERRVDEYQVESPFGTLQPP